MSGLNYLITGANRGIGLGLAGHYLALGKTTVIAAIRDPSSVTDLKALKAGIDSKLIVVKIDSLSTSDALAAVEELKTKHGITHLDVVIANAGLGSYWGPALTTPIGTFNTHFQVNATGPLILFQAVHELLTKAKEPKFIPIGTPVGSVTEMEEYPLPSTAYGTSKAALNFLTKKLSLEHEGMVIFPLAPGWVRTEMGKGAAGMLFPTQVLVINTDHQIDSVGMEDAPVSIEDSVAGLCKVVWLSHFQMWNHADYF